MALPHRLTNTVSELRSLCWILRALLKLIHRSSFASSQRKRKSWTCFWLRVQTEVFTCGERSPFGPERRYKLRWHKTEASSGGLRSSSEASVHLYLQPG